MAEERKIELNGRILTEVLVLASIYYKPIHC